LSDVVRFDLRAFPLEEFNRRPTPYDILSAEVPVVGALEPEAGWQVWQGRPGEWPVTTLPALEAVQAAKAQGLAASEALDRALRRALFAESRCISILPVILEVAESCGAVDVDRLGQALRRGEARATVYEQMAEAEAGGVKGSPHVFLPDGTDAHNPGIQMHWQGEHGRGFPVVDHDDPGAYKELLERAAGG
jgi:hypothetical protein